MAGGAGKEAIEMAAFDCTTPRPRCDPWEPGEDYCTLSQAARMMGVPLSRIYREEGEGE